MVVLTVMRAMIGGLGDVLRAPVLIMMAAVATLIIAVPFAIVPGVRVQQSLSLQQPVAQGAIEIDAEWWQEFSAHADGIAATFTPAIIGFAAPLDNLSCFCPRGWWGPLGAVGGGAGGAEGRRPGTDVGGAGGGPSSVRGLGCGRRGGVVVVLGIGCV